MTSSGRKMSENGAVNCCNESESRDGPHVKRLNHNCGELKLSRNSLKVHLVFPSSSLRDVFYWKEWFRKNVMTSAQGWAKEAGLDQLGAFEDGRHMAMNKCIKRWNYFWWNSMRRDDLVPAVLTCSFPVPRCNLKPTFPLARNTLYAVNFLSLALVTSQRTCAHVITQTSRDRSAASTVINAYVASRPAAVMWLLWHHVACAPRASRVTFT